MRIPGRKFRASNLLAIAIAIAMMIWLASGVFFNEKETARTIAERNADFEAASRDAGPTSVRTLMSTSRATSPVVTLRGHTRNKRSVLVRSETDGRVEARPVNRGSRVAAGDLLCELAVEDRQAKLTEAEASRTRAEIDYEGARELYEQGLISDVELANRSEHLARAKANETTGRLALQRTRVLAPFVGVVEETQAEIGSFLRRGEGCVTLMDFDPMLVVGRVSEFDVSALSVGDAASAVLVSGETIEGQIRFIGRDSRDGTRTYQVEVEVPNPDQSLRSGVTAEIKIPLSPVLAHRIMPNLLRLDDLGQLGVYTVNSENRAEFHTIEILRDDESGFWVTGLPDVTQLVVRGQGILIPGQAVRPERMTASSTGFSPPEPPAGN